MRDSSASVERGSPFLVTGGASGIGLAIAHRLVRHEARVAICGRDRAAIEQATKALQAEHRNADSVVGITADLANASDPARVVGECVRVFGSIRGLVNNAGISTERALIKMSAKDWDETLHINLRAAALASAAAVKQMIADGRGGRIVHIASVNAFASEAAYAHYSASKAGLVSLAKSMAIEHAKDGIVTNAVAPGWVRTRMTEAALNAMGRDDLRRINPSGRAASPDEIAAVVEFLCFDAPSFLIGETIVVDGGQSITHPLQ
jgi:NAD(P)-dependent dehydrogenase (short-subunit alcohol dehydrogenase family)